ncbi:hypothetical protein ACJMK2_003501 [Sinanodonta woodiana]|uniref:VLIG-type G domain-containing protein n=1 Tax=Sinanodonta woodiana TaxID=1069815 RepID=A0ABD3Y1R8_SINWO
MEQENTNARQTTSRQSHYESSDVTSDEEFMTFLRKLDLYKYYPGKLKREDVVGLMSDAPDEKTVERTEDLGTIFLHRLLSCNYGARDLEIVTESTRKPVTAEKVDNPFPSTSILAKRKQLSSRPGESQANAIHPLDVVLSVFLCADPILQQDIATLLWKCKLAIPFITMPIKSSIPQSHIWPLRGISARWTVRKGGTLVVEEDNILSPSFFTMGFMRFQSASVEKSIRINTLMSDTERAHPIFYHRNSKGSTRERRLANGMVEISWYLPSSSEGNLFNEPITVLNLRGNAIMYPRQRQILMEMSSICFMVCSSSDLDNEEIESIVKTIISMNKKVFIITYDTEENKEMKIIQVDDNVFIFNTECLTDSELKECIKFRIREMELNISLQRTSINTFSWNGILLDQEIKAIKDGYLQAEIIMDSLLREQIDCRKDKLLPLHQDLWKTWVETDKEIHKLKKLPKLKDITEYRNQLEKEKVDHRGKQFEILQRGVSEAISNFMKALDMKDNISRAVCVRWLRIQLDQLSRRELRLLLDKEMLILDAVNDLKNTTIEKEDNLQKELANIQELKNKSHIGLEHFFREIGQIYEAIQTQPPGKRINIGYELPLLAARFLLDGNSFEIFDGDAGSVPIQWVSAVFERLSDKVKEFTGRENPKCTVLTVYGMQSSGKSTLLNTMFGCQFSVGAGRCTRGAQIQMLKVNDSERKGMKVDYILLVDTEGVRSPEMPEEIRRPRDNEITTFVVGLGQKTLINLMGENTTYLTEVLPIAVRAFLRMETVGLKPSCAIIYQNVDSQSRDEISSQNRKLKDELDNQTLSACQMEKKESKHFQDVIQFDVEKDIHYIPSLWEGEQPMATVSQGYCKGVLKLKHSFQQFCKQHTGQDLASYHLHVESLWRSIAKDDFVYYFKNTLETEARERLDKFWCNVVWNLRMEASKFGIRMHTDIKNCSNSDKLEESISMNRVKLRDEISSAYELVKKQLVDFFDAAPQKYKQYMVQWKVSSIDGLTRIKEDLNGALRTDMLRLQGLKESQFAVERNVQQFKDKIRNEIIQYFKEERNQFDGNEGTMMPKGEIRQLFEDKWDEWLKSVKDKCDVNETKTNIAREAVDILREKFSSHETLVIEKSDTVLSGTVLEFQLKRSHLIRNVNDVTASTFMTAEAIVLEIIQDVRKRLNELTQDPSPYKKGSLEEIIQIVSAKEGEIEALGVKTTTEFEIEISIAVVSMAVSAFSASEKRFLQSFDPIYLLEMEKETFFVLFEKNYDKTKFSHSFAKRVYDLLTTSVINRVHTDIVQEVADDMRSRVYMDALNNKKSFIYTIMCRMASEGIFRRFMDYIRNPTQAIEDWLGRYVDEYASADSGNKSKLTIIVERLVTGYVKDLTVYAEETEKHLDVKTDNPIEMDRAKDVQVQLWVQEFTKMASEKFEINKIRRLTDAFGEEILDIRYFYVEFMKRLESTYPKLDDLTSKGKSSFETMRGDVVKSLKDLVIGCTGDCPFCGEICISSQTSHGGLHETPVHRPQGCKGYANVHSRILVQESCQKLVASTHQKFLNDRTNGQFVYYKDYQTIHTDWKIPGDPNPLNSSFWEWFMITYIVNLEQEHHSVRPNMPDVWKTYNKESEIEKLKREMNR